jgi:hypothetical protein
MPRVPATGVPEGSPLGRMSSAGRHADANIVDRGGYPPAVEKQNPSLTGKISWRKESFRPQVSCSFGSGHGKEYLGLVVVDDFVSGAREPTVLVR